MDPRTQYIAYMEDLAKRHADIAHNPASKASTRFFLELDYEQLMGWTEPSNLGWNMVLMGFETVMDDNRHGGRVEKVVCLFDILKHVKRTDDPDELQATYTAAREIGEEILVRMREHQDNPCTADVSAGIVVPYSLQWAGKRTIEVGPRWDNYYGYRFNVDLLVDQGVKRASTPEKWITP
jgi:hypothetical protein